MTSHDLQTRRSRVLGASYATFYDQPLHLVRGTGVLLYDADGNEYLDCYNNVPSVGHCHPRVVAALTEQAATLNTHTRYIHENVVELGERLGSLLPGDLSACWFTCTGTEANDLAIQIARAATSNHGVIVTEGAYHGNSTLVRVLSPDDRRGMNRPDWVVTVEAPNQYRTPFPDEADLGESYGRLVADACAELDSRGHGVAAMLVDPSWDANGVLVAPDGYLTAAAAAVRASGGLMISDEVQAGYCRLGEQWWGHGRYGLVPDMVTMGKPMGAGHPVAACVTTPKISAEFGRQRGYFNTFGGNPVSAAVALSVLDVIEDEGLLENATNTGAYMASGLHDLAAQHDAIGHIHGSGLFWGVELVADPESKEPLGQTVVASLVSNLAQQGILMGQVGEFGNIIKIRPPLPFGPSHVDRAIESLNAALTG